MSRWDPDGYGTKSVKSGAARRRKFVAILIKKHGQVCKLCGGEITNPSHITLDHIIPTSKGGKNRLSNLQLAHKKCNEKKGNNFCLHPVEKRD